MSYDTGRIVAGFGAVLFLLGLLLGFVPQSAGGVNCGSPFVGSQDAYGADLDDALQADAEGLNLEDIGEHQAACDDRLGMWRTVTWLLIGAGVGVWVLSIVIRPAPADRDDGDHD